MVSSVPYHKVHLTEGRPRRQLGARAAARRDLRPRGEWPYVGAGEELPGDGDRTSDRDRGGQELGEGGRGREGLGRRCQPKPKNDLAIFTEKKKVEKGSAWRNISKILFPVVELERVGLWGRAAERDS